MLLIYNVCYFYFSSSTFFLLPYIHIYTYILFLVLLQYIFITLVLIRELILSLQRVLTTQN